MMTYFTCPVNRFAIKMTCFNFLTSTLLMLLLLFVKADFLFVCAFIFLGISGVVNSITVFCLIVTLFLNFKYVEQHALALVVALLHYPITFLYIHFVL
ncbi:hypothetical protein [Ulvibacterium sp.]|uniref:hypothetical protein n=1 Tax=Ulvibacterium sp. TaxID=2665914 RepID=UPI00260B7125|nr:hypothetical protein [Ulvibacterium sp.]